MLLVEELVCIDVEPIAKCIRNLQSEREYDEIIYLTPDGDRLNQPLLNQMSMSKNLLMLCGHYKGIDQRIRDMFITREISLGIMFYQGRVGCSGLSGCIRAFNSSAF